VVKGHVEVGHGAVVAAEIGAAELESGIGAVAVERTAGGGIGVTRIFPFHGVSPHGPPVSERIFSGP
jgi:hypothetical protein